MASPRTVKAVDGLFVAWLLVAGLCAGVAISSHRTVSAFVFGLLLGAGIVAAFVDTCLLDDDG